MEKVLTDTLTALLETPEGRLVLGLLIGSYALIRLDNMLRSKKDLADENNRLKNENSLLVLRIQVKKMQEELKALKEKDTD